MKRSSAPVLVVEDDHFLRQMVVETLQKNGKSTMVARDGKEALDCVKKSSPSLIVLDLLMPVIDGFQVLEYLQKEHSDIPVVVLTNLSDTLNRKRCKDAGCKGFLVKSDLDTDNLWPALSKFL